jgi:hypothetical protein
LGVAISDHTLDRKMVARTPHLPHDEGEEQIDQGNLVVEAIERQRRPGTETVSPVAVQS